jgi:hypothetical protein
MGVAVRTSVGRLWDVIAEDASDVVGRVHYLDFKSAFAGVGDERIFCKRASLSHEREVRVVLKNRDHDKTPGKLLNCDLNALISSVTISPFAPIWFSEVVENVTCKFGFSFEVRRSDLVDEPFY